MSTQCNEFQEEVMSVIAIPLANIPAIVPNSLANRLTPTIPGSDMHPLLTGSISIGHQPSEYGGVLIPLLKKTVKVDDEEGDSVAGRLHTVTVTCDADSRDYDMWEPILALERGAYHLLITFRGGGRAFVASNLDNYLCTTKRDGAKTSITFRVKNLMGVQMCTE